jgi:CRP-like cAMP-binding protein
MIEAQQSRSPADDGRARTRPPPPLDGDTLSVFGRLVGAEQPTLAFPGSPTRIFEAGTDLVREGSDAASLYILVEGWACRFSTTAQGGRQICGFVLPGEIANLDSVIFDRTDLGVRAITQLRAVAVPRRDVLNLANESPDLAQTFARLAMIEKAGLSQWAVSLGRRSAKERVAHLLCELAARLHHEQQDGSGFDFPLTQEQIADAAGLTAVHVNRTMQQLRSEGLIVTRERRMILPDIARLRSIAGFSPGYLHLDAFSRSDGHVRG